MQRILEKVNPLQMVLVALLVALLSGVLPLAEGVDINAITVSLVALIGAAKVVDEFTARLLIKELAKIDFADDRLDEFFDKLDMVSNAMGETGIGSTVVNVNPAVASELPVDSPTGLKYPRG